MYFFLGSPGACPFELVFHWVCMPIIIWVFLLLLFVVAILFLIPLNRFSIPTTLNVLLMAWDNHPVSL